MTYSVGIYARISVEHEYEPSLSVENQTELIKNYIKELGDEYKIYGVYTDRGVSGTTFERAGFIRLLDDVSAGRVNCIMVKDLSRLGRNYIETGNYLEKLFPALGVRFIAVSDGYDTMCSRAEDDKLSMNIKNLVNELYARDISQKVRAVKGMAQKNGEYVGGTPPYGYICERQAGLRRLCINEEARPVIKKIYECRRSGMSYQSIASVLYQDKIHTPKDSARLGRIYCGCGEKAGLWSPSAISKIINKPFYATDFKIEEDFKTEDETPSHSEQEPAEKSREKNGGSSVFGKIIYCGECGKKMKTLCRKNKKNEETVYSYYCGRFSPDGKKRCRNYIRQETLCLCMKKAFETQEHIRGLNARDFSRLNGEALVKSLRAPEQKNAAERRRIGTCEAAIYEAYSKSRQKKISCGEYKKIKERQIKRINAYKDSLAKTEKEEELLYAGFDEREKIIAGIFGDRDAGAKERGLYGAALAEAFFYRVNVSGGKKITFLSRLKRDL